MDELSPEFQELDLINPHEKDKYNVLRENCKRYREALEEIAKCTDYPTCDIAQQALDEVDY